MDLLKKFFEENQNLNNDNIIKISNIVYDIVQEFDSITYNDCYNLIEEICITRKQKGKSSIDQDTDQGESSTSDQGESSTSDQGESSTSDQGESSTSDQGESSTSDQNESSTSDQNETNTSDQSETSISDQSETSTSDQSDIFVSELDLVSLKNHVLKYTHNGFDNYIHQKIKERGNDVYVKFNKNSKYHKAYMCLEQENFGLGITFVDSLDNLGYKQGKFPSNKEMFEKRMEMNMDFGELTDLYLEETNVSNYYNERNEFMNFIVNEENLYSFSLLRTVDFILDIYVPKNLDWIEIRNRFGKLVASCTRSNYERIDEKDVKDPYILENYRRVPLFETLLPLTALPFISFKIVIPDISGRILTRCSVVRYKYRKFLNKFKDPVKFRKIPSLCSNKKNEEIVCFTNDKGFYSL